MSWAKKMLEYVKDNFDFTGADAAPRLQQCWDHLTELLKRTLGLLIAEEHAEMCRVLMEAHLGEDFPQVEFTVWLIYLMHRAGVGWWRAAMEAFISKSTYLYSNFGKDLLWTALGTAAKRPKLHVRSIRNGRCEWADFLDCAFFRVARQHGKAAASAAAAEAQGKQLKANGLGPGYVGATSYNLGAEPSSKNFFQRNKGRAENNQPVLWPRPNKPWIELAFSKIICP